MNVKKYSIEFLCLGAEIQVEIDFDFVDTNGKTSLDYIKEMVDFWHGSERRLEDNNSDYVMTFLQQMGRFVFNEAPAVIDLADWLKEEEGWCYVDGDCGIKITRYDKPVFGIEDIDITEI